MIVLKLHAVHAPEDLSIDINVINLIKFEIFKLKNSLLHIDVYFLNRAPINPLKFLDFPYVFSRNLLSLSTTYVLEYFGFYFISTNIINKRFL